MVIVTDNSIGEADVLIEVCKQYKKVIIIDHHVSFELKIKEMEEKKVDQFV